MNRFIQHPCEQCGRVLTVPSDDVPFICGACHSFNCVQASWVRHYIAELQADKGRTQENVRR